MTQQPALHQPSSMQRHVQATFVALLCAMVVLPCLCIGQLVNSVSRATVPLHGGTSITLYGQQFPVSEPTWIVFLSGRYDLTPQAMCAVDTFLSTTSAAVCASLPVFPAAEIINASVFQRSATYFVGLKTTSSTAKYFFTSESVAVMPIIDGILLGGVPSVVSATSLPQIAPVKISGNVSSDDIYGINYDISFRMSEGIKRAVCSLVPAASLSAQQLSRVRSASEFPFSCPVGISSGFYDVFLLTQGDSASIAKIDAMSVLRYGPQLDTYSTYVPPVVTSVSPTTVSVATNVTFTIHGSGFGPAATDNVVTMGGSACTVIAASTTAITCRGQVGTTAASTPVSGGTGYLRRFFSVTQSTAGPVSLAELRAAIPSGDLASGAGALLSDVVVTDLDFPAGSLEEATQSLTSPVAAVHEAFVTPAVSGDYTFYCIGSESAILQIYSGAAWTDLCSAASSETGPAMALVGQASAVSATQTLTAGTTIKLRAVFGISNASTSVAKFSMGLNQTGIAGTPKIAVPHVVRIVATRTAGQTPDFTVTVGPYVSIAVAASSTCNGIATSIRYESTGNFAVEESIVTSSSECTWYLRFVGDTTADAAVNATGTGVTIAVVAAGAANWFFDAIPSYLATAPYDLSGIASQGLVRVVSHDRPAHHKRASNVASPFLVAATNAAPNACTLNTVELATSGLTLFVASSAFLSTSPTLDFVAYNGAYQSLGRALTLVNTTHYSLTVPTTLSSSVYEVFLNQGAFGRISCGSVVQGFQAILVSPTSGTRNGGTRVTVTGSNFPTKLSGFSVFIGGAPCVAFYATVSTILCRTTAMLTTPTEVPVSSSTSATTFFVRLYANQTNLPAALSSYSSYAPFGGSLAPRFSYALTGIPTITSVSPQTGAGALRNTVTITGTNLASSAFSLCNASLTTCAPIVCPALTLTSTTAVCTTPRLAPLTYYVVARSTSGRSNTNVNYTSILRVDNTTPSFLSPDGGSTVTIAGAGFGPGTTVVIGKSPCTVAFVNSSMIRCTTTTPIGGESAVPQVRIASIAQGTAAVPNGTSAGIETIFSSESADAPTVPFFYPTSGNGVGTTITIAALNFPTTTTNPSEVLVTIGATPCQTYFIDVESEPVLLFCNRTASAPAGTDAVTVRLGAYGVLGSGSPNPDVPYVITNYTHTLAVSAISPLTGSTAGGTYVTVEGLGFGTSAFSVIMGTVNCRAGAAYDGTSVAVDRVVCILDAAPSQVANQSEFIYVQSREVISIYGQKFTFETSSTALLTKASPLTGNAGTTISLSVTNVNVTNVLSLLIVGVEIPVTYVSSDDSFSAILPSLPAFRSPLQLKTRTGYSRSASSIVFVSYPTISSITPQQANSAGGTLITVNGQRFGRTGFPDALRVLICGNECVLVSYNLTRIVCKAPPLRNVNTISSTTRAALVAYAGTYTGSVSSASTAATLIMDGDVATGTVVTRSTAGLSVGLDLGDYQSAHILKVAIFPTAGYEAALVGATVQSSTDGATWRTLSTLVSVQPGWNTLSYRTKTLYAQYIRIVPLSTVAAIGIQEITITGVRGVSTSATICPLIVTMKPSGSDLMTTCLQQPLLCINVDTSIRITFTTAYSPTITRIQPETGTTRGGSAINLYGSFQTVSTTDIVVVAGGLPCTVTRALAAQLDCTTSPAYVDAVTSQVTSLQIAGFGDASLTTPPFYFAESWSSPDAWSFGSMPTTGSIVVIPAGVTIVLDASPVSLAGLIIYGTLMTTTDVNIEIKLEAGFILIQDTGALLVGTSTNPFSSTLTISIAPSDIEDPVYGTSYLAVNGGKLSLSGLATSSVFGALSQAANAGDMFISIAGITTWSSGSQIVIPTSTSSMAETEVRTVTSTAINGSNTVFYFTQPLTYSHLQGTETNALGLSASYTTVVGLLSRTVKVTSSDVDRRGYVIASRSQNGVAPTVSLYYCEFSYLGQRNLHRRYALSFVNIQAPEAAALTGVSVYHSENRGIYFEDSQHIASTFVVVYNTVGHGISSDDDAKTKYLSFTSTYVLSAVAGEVDTKASNFYFTHPEVNISSSYAIGAAFAGYAFNLKTSNNRTDTCPQDASFGTLTRNYAQATDVGFTVYPAHARRTFPCGVTDPIANPTVVTTVSILQFFRNRRRHIELGEVGSWTIASCWMMDAEDVSISVSAVSSGVLTISATHVVAHASPTLVSGVIPVMDSVLGIRGVRLPDRSGNVVLSTVYFSGFNGTTAGAPHVAMSVCEGCVSTFNSGRTVAGYMNYGRALQFVQTGTAMYFMFHPPYNSVFLDMDGTFNSNSANSTILATAPHLLNLATAEGLPSCVELARTQFATVDSTSAPLMVCPGTYSMHLVRVVGNFSGSPLAVYSAYGTTEYGTQPSALVPGLHEGVVVIPSGTISLNSLTVNVSALNYTIVPGANTDWDRMVVVIPNTLKTLSGQLAIKFNFSNPVYAVNVFARTRSFVGTGLLSPTLNGADAQLSTISTYLGSPTNRAPTANATTAFVVPTSVLVSVTSSPLSNGVPLVFDFHSSRCDGNETCVSQSDAHSTTISYIWTDVRAWPRTGKVPTDGETAIIPRGVYVTLTSSTARLRALIIEGTLEFHFRLSCSLTANFVVVNGGSLIAGSSALPYEPKSYINLVRDTTISPMTVTSTIAIESGTLLNMGYMQLVGTPKTVPWTSLGALLGEQSFTVTTSDVLDWNVDEVVAISSSNYDPSLTEYMTIGQLASDNRGFTGRGPSTLQHDWYTMTINDNTKVTTAAKLAVLNRTIVIRGTGTEPGCQVLFDERPTAAFAASGILSNVQFDRCGIQNGTKYGAAEGAAIRIRNVQRSAVTITQNAVHDSLAGGISLTKSTAITITSNAVVGTRGSSIVFDATSAGNQVTGNLVFMTEFSAAILADPSIPAALCSFDSRYALNTFQSNVAAGSVSEGFCVQLPACTDTVNTNTGNEAHSCVVGHFTAHREAAVTCVAINSFHAWHNSFIGLYSAVAGDSQVLSCSLHDNHIQVLLGREGSGTNTLRNSVIGGRAGYFDDLSCDLTQCVANRIYGTCRERRELLNDGSRSFLRGEIGILVFPFLLATPTAEYSRARDADPFFRYNNTAVSPTFSSNIVDNNIFYYWYRGNDFGRCGGSTAIAVDGFASLRLPTTMLSNSSWVTFNDDARIYIPAPVASWKSNTAMCDGRECDALLHVAITDLDGGFYSQSAPASTISNYLPASRTCEFKSTWNAFLCASVTVGQLTLRDYGTVSIDSFNLEPLTVREDQQEDVVDVTYLPPRCATPSTDQDTCSLTDNRAHDFNPLLRLNLRYDLDFFVEAPRRLRMTLDSCGYPLGRVELRVKYPLNGLLSVWVYDGPDSSVGTQAETLTNLVLKDSPVGSHYYDVGTERLRVIMQCGSTIEIHTVVFATVAMLLQTSVEDFSYAVSDAFLANVSDYLVLDPARISLEAVYPGSAVAVMELKGNDEADYLPAPAAAEINNYVLGLIGYSSLAITNNLGFPVLQTVAAEWANELPKTVAPTEVDFSLSVGLIVSLAVVSFAIVVILAVLQYRLFLAIINYTDEDGGEKNDEDPLKGSGGDDDNEQAADENADAAAPSATGEKPHVTVEDAHVTTSPVDDHVELFEEN